MHFFSHVPLHMSEKSVNFATANKNTHHMPEVSRFYGIVIGMYYGDHNPPHFHVRYNDYRAVINILTGEVEGKLPRRVLTLTFEWLDLHKDDLMNNWKRMENGEVVVEIKPLD